MAGWADGYLSLEDYYHGRLDRAATRLERVAGAATSRSYLALRGQCYWMLGARPPRPGPRGRVNRQLPGGRPQSERIRSVEGVAALDALLGTNLDISAICRTRGRTEKRPCRPRRGSAAGAADTRLYKPRSERHASRIYCGLP